MVGRKQTIHEDVQRIIGQSGAADPGHDDQCSNLPPGPELFLLPSHSLPRIDVSSDTCALLRSLQCVKTSERDSLQPENASFLVQDQNFYKRSRPCIEKGLSPTKCLGGKRNQCNIKPMHCRMPKINHPIWLIGFNVPENSRTDFENGYCLRCPIKTCMKTLARLPSS